MQKYSRRELIKTATSSLVATLMFPANSLASTSKKSLTSRNELYTISEKDLLARMIFGEARDCLSGEQAIIGYTALNRAKDKLAFNGEKNLYNVLLRINQGDHQYDCFDDKNPRGIENFLKTLNPEEHDLKAWKECRAISQMVINGEFSSLDRGQTIYVKKSLVKRWKEKKKTPAWFKNIEEIPYFDMMDLEHKIAKDPAP